MKRTTTINLAGMVFHIEEDGYQLLAAYFKEIRRVFSKEEGGDEIIHDIEARFAELFNERLSEYKEVVTEADVDEVIGIMGSPNQFDEDYKEEPFGSHFHDAYQAEGKKRLYRDVDDGMIAGVAAGTAHYFGLDPALLRILWIVFVLLGGSGILVYIIAWIAIPPARTTSEKLQMRGESVNLDTIKMYAENIEKEARKGFERASRSFKRTMDSTSKASSSFASGLLRFFGFILLLLGVGGVVALTTGMVLNYADVSINGELISTDFTTITDLFFIQQHVSFAAIYLVALIPILFIIIFGIRLLTASRIKLKSLSVVLVVVWSLSLFVLIFTAIRSGMEFKESYTVEDAVYLPVEQEQIRLRLFDGNKEVTERKDYDFDDFLLIEDELVSLGYASLEIVATSDSVFHYYVEKEAKGSNLKEAKKRAENISYTISKEENDLLVPARYEFLKNDRYRVQKVKVTVYVPVGKEIYIQGNLEEYPIKVKTITRFDKDDVEESSTWLATERGMTRK